MPDGYRRGGTYTRNGRTFQRRGASIKPRTALMVTAAAGVAITAGTGGALIGSPVMLAVGVCGVLGYLAYRNRRRLAPVGRRLLKRAEKRYGKRNTRPVMVARVPRQQRRIGVVERSWRFWTGTPLRDCGNPSVPSNPRTRLP